MTITARRGVILGAGGFERNQPMRERYLPQPTQAQWSATPPANTGDAIAEGHRLGGALALMTHVWGAPTVGVAGEEKQRALFVERNLPGCVIVNRLGKRFVNEAAPYSGIRAGDVSRPCAPARTCRRGWCSTRGFAASIRAGRSCRRR